MTPTLEILLTRASRLPDAAQDRLARRWLQDVDAQVGTEADAADWGDLAPRPVRERVAGLGRGTVQMSSDFDDPLPDSFWMGDG